MILKPFSSNKVVYSLLTLFNLFFFISRISHHPPPSSFSSLDLDSSDHWKVPHQHPFQPPPAHLRPLAALASASQPSVQQQQQSSSTSQFPNCDPANDFTNQRTIQYGRDAVRLSVLHEGSGNRVRRFMKKLESGQPITMGVLGGSVTRGHGLQFEQGGVNATSWQYRIFDWIKTTYPNEAHKLVSGPVPAVVVSYFSVCFDQHISDDVDIVFVEMDINSFRHDEDVRSFETLYRQLLSLPKSPAVISMSVFGIVFHEITMGFHAMYPTAQYHDIPVISLRGWALQHLYMHPLDKKELFFNHVREFWDYRHINVKGHRALADFGILFLQKQACELKVRESDEWGKMATRPGELWPMINFGDYGIVPKIKQLASFPFESEEAEITPTIDTAAKCRTISSEMDPLRASSLLTDSADQGGWSEESIDDKKFFVTKTVGAKISFPISVKSPKDPGQGAEIGLFIWRTTLKAPEEGAMGRVGCWIEGLHKEPRSDWTEQDYPLNKWEGVMIDGWRNQGLKIVEWTRVLRFKKPVPQGEHTLSCILLPFSSSGAREFRIQGITVLG